MCALNIFLWFWRKMLRRFGLMIFLIPILTPPLIWAEMKVFEKVVKEVVGRHQSQDEVEDLALQRAERLAVAEAGTFVSSLTIVRNFQLPYDKIITFISGFVQSEVVGVP